jgi:hypothetical protein
MIGKPRICTHRIRRILANNDDVLDLQPSEDTVLSCTLEPPSAIDAADCSEQTEEQEQVAFFDNLISEMTLCSAHLPKRTTPTWPARHRLFVQIRIEMAMPLRPCVIVSHRAQNPADVVW